MAVDLPFLQGAVPELGLGWRPGETVHSAYSVLQARSRLGAIPPGGREALLTREVAALTRTEPESAAAVKLPAAWDWRNVTAGDLPKGNYVTPIKDQAGCGSCVAFGTTAVLESMVRIAARQPGLTVNLSEAHAFFCYGPDHGAGACPDGGWWPADALGAMKKGVVDEACYVYTDADQPCRIGSDWKSRLTTFSHWTTRTSRTAMKTYLATVGPMSACFTIYEDFFKYYTGGIYTFNEKTSGDYIGGHCVTIVGYDDLHKCWIAKNSWGDWWGEEGYFRIAYASAGIDAEMWGIDGTVASPLIRTRLQTVAVSGGNLWTTTRRASGTWSALAEIDAPPVPDPGAFTSLCAAATINRLHVIGLIKGVPSYTRKRSGAGWAKFQAIASTLPKGVKKFSALSCAAIGDALHVVGIGNGSLWYTSRSAKGTWKATWTPLLDADHDPAAFTAVSVAAVGKRLAVAAIANGGLATTLRNTDGTWPATFTNVTAAVPEEIPDGLVTAVSAAGVGSALHLVAVAGGRLLHGARGSSGTWPSEFRLLAATGPGPIKAVAAADVGLQLQVVVLSGGELWHLARSAGGTWGTVFTRVTEQVPSVPGPFGAVDCA